MENQIEKLKGRTHVDIAGKIEAIAWGIFFIWVGIAFLTDIGYGPGLLGIGLITLGAQVARSYFHLELEGFWLVVGAAFTLAGIWEFISPGVSFVAILMIIAGIALVYSVWNRKQWID